MNSDSLAGEGKDLGGKVKETAGDVTGDTSLEGEGMVDQVSGKLQKALGGARDAVNDGAGPLADRVRGFARDRPWAAAAVAGVLGVALLNTLRGKK